MANLYVQAAPPTDLNRNTEWFMYPGVWTTYILILFFSWLVVLSVFGCSPGMAWTTVHLFHFVVTYHFFHWKKGTPFSDDQGIYNRLTWWEQIDNGKQLTRNRKFLTVVPVVLGNKIKGVISRNLYRVLDSLAYNRLSIPYDLLQYTDSFYSRGCQVPTYAQSSYLWHQC